jgi:hypothetical protein
VIVMLTCLILSLAAVLGLTIVFPFSLAAMVAACRPPRVSTWELRLALALTALAGAFWPAYVTRYLLGFGVPGLESEAMFLGGMVAAALAVASHQIAKGEAVARPSPEAARSRRLAALTAWLCGLTPLLLFLGAPGAP